jgi:RecB family exonuclease
MPYKLSPSSLNLFKECPRCFWLQFNKGIKRPDTIFPSLPSGMDKVLKEHFDRFMRKHELPPELRSLKGIKLFEDEELLGVWRSNFKGIQWTDKEGNVLRGAVDNILVKKDKLIVLDYKTRGFPLKEDTADHYKDQLDIYNFLLRENSYKTENYAYLLFYHPNKVNEKGDVIFNTDLIKIKIDVKNARHLFDEAISTLKNDIPEPSKECQFCRFSSSP